MNRHAQHGMRREGRWIRVLCRCGELTPRRRFTITALIAHRRHARIAVLTRAQQPLP